MNPSVNILYSPSLDKFHIGQSIDVSKRIEEHNHSAYQGSFTTRTSDWELFYVLECETKYQAIKIEEHIKRMKMRKYYFDIKRYPEIGKKLLEKYSESLY
jgi:putative endonuclease